MTAVILGDAQDVADADERLHRLLGAQPGRKHTGNAAPEEMEWNGSVAPRSLGPVWRSTPGRNDSCPCGSGREYKRCCGA